MSDQTKKERLLRALNAALELAKEGIFIETARSSQSPGITTLQVREGSPFSQVAFHRKYFGMVSDRQLHDAIYSGSHPIAEYITKKFLA